MEIIDKMNIKENTKKNYKIKYKKVISLGFIIEASEQNIINKLEYLVDTELPNNINDYCNIIYLIRRDLNIPVDLIKEYKKNRKILIADSISNTNLNFIKSEYPSLQELREYTGQLYNNNEYSKFIINFLLLSVYCRNADLDVFITKKEPTDKVNNYLLVKNNEVIFIRANYKTSKSYNTKIDKITDESFIYACNQLAEQKLIKYNNNIGNHIKDVTLNKIGQSRYMKIILLESDKNKLLDISKKRGTAIDTLLRFYDLNRE
jgi:hypothetical protein